jgi:hypothetical protein
MTRLNKGLVLTARLCRPSAGPAPRSTSPAVGRRTEARPDSSVSSEDRGDRTSREADRSLFSSAARCGGVASPDPWPSVRNTEDISRLQAPSTSGGLPRCWRTTFSVRWRRRSPPRTGNFWCGTDCRRSTTGASLWSSARPFAGFRALAGLGEGFGVRNSEPLIASRPETWRTSSPGAGSSASRQQR